MWNSITANKNRLIIIQSITSFLFTVFIYFKLSIPYYDDASFLAVIVKCAPIISLIYFVRNFRTHNNDNNNNSYKNKILIGLIFCCIGDAFLIHKNGFIFGMIAFVCGHVNYTLAFGFEPLKIKLLLFIKICAIIIILILSHGLNGILSIGVPIYIFVISIMVWRASARIQEYGNSWLSILCCIGSIFFAISDTIIGIDKFLMPVPKSQLLIMSTYYFAQLSISLSILEF